EQKRRSRLSAAGALRDGATDAPGIHGIQTKRAFRRAIVAFRPPPFLRAVRAGPAASRLQPAPPIGLLVWIGEGVQNSSVFLHETDPCQVRPSRRRNVLSGRLTPQYLTQQFVEPPVVALTKQPLMLRVLANRQLCAAAAAAHRVRGPFAPGGPCFRHRRSAGRALF